VLFEIFGLKTQTRTELSLRMRDISQTVASVTGDCIVNFASNGQPKRLGQLSQQCIRLNSIRRTGCYSLPNIVITVIIPRSPYSDDGLWHLQRDRQGRVHYTNVRVIHSARCSLLTTYVTYSQRLVRLCYSITVKSYRMQFSSSVYAVNTTS